ncbi:MAG TPA: FAD-dependent oxidoreductase [Miltoncostaeaceae bacterium]|nr:FAD-dependent oxidoreductase [Miltoncostaeaceae bacterium]
MATAQTHDLIVIGSGMAGLNAAAHAAGLGERVALVESGMIGGTCPTRGCIPSKALIRSAEIAHDARRAGEFGIRVGAVAVDMPAVIARVQAIIRKGSDGARAYIESLEAVELIEAEAAFTAPRAVVADGRELTAPRVIVASGATATVPPIPGLDEVPYLTSDDVLFLDHVPGRLVVIGGGPIALELGQALSRFGSNVTIVEVLPRLLPDGEPELTEELAGLLADEGIQVLAGATIERVRPGPVVDVVVGGSARALTADALLVAAGRAPRVNGLGLEAAGVRMGKKGVDVDHGLRTSAEGVFAAGDVVGPPYGQFTHVARAMGVAAAANALDADSHDIDPDAGPRAIFTDPELVAIGMTESAAREAGHDVGAATVRFAGGKARAWGEERGMAKVVVDRRARRILGAQILAYHGADLIHPVGVAMAAGDVGLDALLGTMHVHPTLGEKVLAAAQAAATPS